MWGLQRGWSVCGSWGLCAALAAFAPAAKAQEATVVSLKDALHQEVQQKGFTLPHGMKVHIYAKGGSAGRTFYAYAWILNATTREVVWQMDGLTSAWKGDYQVADRYVDLPSGSYEVYFSNHGFGWESTFSHGTRNIDRRYLKAQEDPKERQKHWFRNTFENLIPARASDWRARVGNYGVEVYVNAADASNVKTFSGPQGWRHEVIALMAQGDNGEWRSAFRVKRAVTLHLYAQGESSDHEMVDTGWILDARTRKKVWEMDHGKAQYAGGASKNRRQVDTIVLQAGDYEAVYITDGSHSPADWNSAPPCDPLRYGLVVSVPKEEDASAVTSIPVQDPSKVIVALVRVGNDRHERTTFSISRLTHVRIYALGEREDDDMVDGAWIENEAGQKVWAMRAKETVRAGGASKNRMADVVIDLPPGQYTLHYKTDDSHAYGDWNDDAPRDAEHYGVTLYRVD